MGNQHRDEWAQKIGMDSTIHEKSGSTKNGAKTEGLFQT
jgi:hypothetical protein